MPRTTSFGILLAAEPAEDSELVAGPATPESLEKLDMRRTASALLALVALCTVAGCSSEPPVYLADDLETMNGRQYITCEDQDDPENDTLEIHVWVSAEQAAQHVKGGPCPDGEIKSHGSKVAGVMVGRPRGTVAPAPAKPTSAVKPSTPAAKPSTAAPKTTAPKTTAPKTKVTK